MADRSIALSAGREPSRRELIADAVVHVVGLVAGLAAAAVLLTLGILQGDGFDIAALLVYALGLLAMLAFSAAYNLARRSRRRALLRRFDHAAIFAMIAGTYTPFTTLRLEGGWSIGLTAAVWGVALTGMVLKLWKPHLVERLSVPLYLALGWIIVVAVNPLLGALDASTLILLGIGGLLYTAGVIFHVWERLPYQNAAWHGFVLAAAMVHYAAVVDAIILGPALPA
ncbi:MAG: hemolysin III family protein [Reyranellaceae bacterium]